MNATVKDVMTTEVVTVRRDTSSRKWRPRSAGTG